jgi:type III secretory pathway component EscV
MPRKQQFSSKQKKQQLQEKRKRKQVWHQLVVIVFSPNFQLLFFGSLASVLMVLIAMKRRKFQNQSDKFGFDSDEGKPEKKEEADKCRSSEDEKRLNAQPVGTTEEPSNTRYQKHCHSCLVKFEIRLSFVFKSKLKKMNSHFKRINVMKRLRRRNP